MLQTKAIAAMRMQEKWEKLSWFGWLAILVTLRARLCNHLKSCNLPKDKNAGVLARLCKNSNTKSHKKLITKNVIARSASIFTVWYEFRINSFDSRNLTGTE